MSAAADELITKQEVAERLHVSTKQVERLLKEGLPFIPVGDRKKMYRVEAVMNWLRSRESCLSGKTKGAVGTPRFVSTTNEYTEYCRLAREKRMLREQKQKSGKPSNNAKS
jgi:phage terminase Nu1 subunit (DNA packaging protein)